MMRHKFGHEKNVYGHELIATVYNFSSVSVPVSYCVFYSSIFEKILSVEIVAPIIILDNI